MPVLPFPFGIADPDRGVAFIGRPGGGGMEMLLLVDGTTVWLQREAMSPVAIADDVVLVRTTHRVASVLPLALLDAGDGSLRRSMNVVLPHGVVTASREFALRAADTQHELVLHWSQRRGYRGGANPSADVLRNLRVGEIEAGIIRIDIVSGNIEQEPAAEAILPMTPPRSMHIGDAIYELTHEMAVEARDSTTGMLRWRRQFESPSVKGPLLPG